MRRGRGPRNDSVGDPDIGACVCDGHDNAPSGCQGRASPIGMGTRPPRAGRRRVSTLVVTFEHASGGPAGAALNAVQPCCATPVPVLSASPPVLETPGSPSWASSFSAAPAPLAQGPVQHRPVALPGVFALVACTLSHRNRLDGLGAFGQPQHRLEIRIEQAQAFRDQHGRWSTIARGGRANEPARPPRGLVGYCVAISTRSAASSSSMSSPDRSTVTLWSVPVNVYGGA